MKKIFVRIFVLLMAFAIACGSLPLSVFAAELGQAEKNSNAPVDTVNSLGFIELNDGYVSVKVSTSNGGYYMSTVEGDVISKADNNSDLVYSDSTFDTSFTSFRITKDGYAVDYMKWEEVLGTIAGDDTVFVALEDAEGVKAFLKRFKDH